MKTTEIISEAYPKKEIRKAVHGGDVSRKMMFSIRKELKAVITKVIGDDIGWEFKQHNTDLGLYYSGADSTYALAKGKQIIGDLFGYFSDGTAKDKARVIKDTDDGDHLVFKVLPFRAPGEEEVMPQFKLVFYRQSKTSGPVIGIIANGK